MSVSVRQFIASPGVPLYYGINSASGVGPRGPATPGPTGPQGPPASDVGNTGPPGPQGPQGFPGATGNAGANSATGATGPVGPVGPIGVSGVSAGPAGATGPVGVDGNAVFAEYVVANPPVSVVGGGQQDAYGLLSAGPVQFQIGYFLARCVTKPEKTICMRLYGQNQLNPSTNTDLISVVGNNINQVDVQQTTIKTLIPSTDFAQVELVNASGDFPGPYAGVQLKSFFTGGGTETWVLSAAPNIISATAF